MSCDALRRPHEFSGGQGQRIAIARAIIGNPKLIVADEPVSALDLSVQAQVLRLIRELRDRHGLAFLLITHSLAVVETISDQIGVMYQGNFVETGSAADIFKRPQHPYARKLIDAEPRLDEPRPAVAGVADTISKSMHASATPVTRYDLGY
jgi:peptide/nickel transport system ATP-binding protein